MRAASAPSMPLKALAATAGAAAVAAGVWVLRTFDPNAAGNLFPPCLFYAFTGLHCPGCGITRALHALVHGDVAGTFAMNALLLPGLCAVALIAAHEIGGRRLLPSWATRVLYDAKLWIGALAAFGVLRNLPWAPYAGLAPG